jgi:geranylgeranyl reductase family protein
VSTPHSPTGTDAVVVGAGPAGVAAAITLVRGGREVVLVDKADFPREKVCGDGLTTMALRHLEELGLEPSTVASWRWADRCTVRSPSGRCVDFVLPDGPGHHLAVATRSDLDAALVDLARKEGVHILTGCGVTGARETGHRVEVLVEDGQALTAPWAIAADGMWSPMRKHLGVGTARYLGEWHAIRQYASEVTGPASWKLFVLFEPDLLPGYFWTFPLPGNRANVGYGVLRGAKVEIKDMSRLWQELLGRPHIRAILGDGAVMEGHHRAWPIPARIDSITPATTRTLFVGDALAACDVMTGEGIGQALLTGTLAARHVLGGGPAARVADDYAAAVRRELLADHRMSELLVRALRHRKGARAGVRIAGTNDWTRRNFARWLFEDYPRGILTTPRRWHRGMLTGPGAYRGA